MNKVLKPTLFVLFFCLTARLFGQLPELEMQQIQIKDEIKTVLNILSNSDDNDAGFALSLARNYYRLDQYEQAEKYYAMLINEQIFSDLDYKAFAICLLNNHKDQLAMDVYYKYITKVNDNATFMDLWKQVINSQPNRNFGIRSSGSSYNLVYGNQNENGNLALNIERGAVVGDLACNTLSNFKALQLPVEDVNRIGSFTEGPKPNSYIFSYQENNGYYVMYYAINKNGKWKNTVALNLGEQMAHYVYPLFVKSENTLYYSSDKSGGLGGLDLYKAQYNGKAWIGNQNLGSTFNTDKNEVLPSIFENKLIFSSNGHPGYGGYDIYSYDAESKAVSIFNKPINSHFDEYVLFIKSETSSVLVGAMGKKIGILNIQKTPAKTIEISGKVTEKAGSGVRSAHILFNHSTAFQGTFVDSDVNGEFKIELPDTVSLWRIQVVHPDYQFLTFNKQLTTLKGEDLSIILEQIESTNKVEASNNSHKNTPSVYTDIKIKEKTEPIEDKPVVKIEVPKSLDENATKYYVVLGAAYSESGANEYLDGIKDKFPNAEILTYPEKNLYRVALYAGSTHSDAMVVYKKAKQIQNNIWLLRP